MKHIALVVASGMMLLCGCVWPGRVDDNVITRYQRAMAERGPQNRTDEGLGLLRPADVTRPVLKTSRDEKTGKTRVLLSLQEAVTRALANSLDIRVVSFDPAISREEMVQAAAEFDYIVFGQLEYDVVDEQTLSLFGGGERFTREWKAGMRQKTVTGATWELAWTMTHTFDTSGFTTQQRTYDNRTVLSVTQPLLRDAWPEFNLAGVRIARLNRRISMQEFRRRVEEIITQVISAYWQLIQVRREWIIQKELLDRTIQTRDRIGKRRKVDATDVEFKQSQAAVETRRAGLIAAEKLIGDAQDRLSRLLSDSQLNMLGDCEILPTTEANSERVRLDETDQLVAALEFSPVLAQLRMAIAVADINVRVAKNQALPKLDLTASTTVQGLGGSAHEARENLETGDFVGYNIGVLLEYPIGNRQRVAEIRRQKLERLKAITDLQNTADQIALQVRERIRQVRASFEELLAQRRAVNASRDQLEALEATEELRRMTPEFLQVKLAAQETLAEAERSEVRALINYNIALAELAQATGTTLELHRVKIAMPAASNAGDRLAPSPGTTPNGARGPAQTAPVGRLGLRARE